VKRAFKTSCRAPSSYNVSLDWDQDPAERFLWASAECLGSKPMPASLSSPLSSVYSSNIWQIMEFANSRGFWPFVKATHTVAFFYSSGTSLEKKGLRKVLNLNAEFYLFPPRESSLKFEWASERESDWVRQTNWKRCVSRKGVAQDILMAQIQLLPANCQHKSLIFNLKSAPRRFALRYGRQRGAC
jgi:hypothetical protein